MVARAHTKSMMLRSGVKLLQERGVHGLTIDAVLTDSGAPRGSVYHHFPRGRDQLIAESAQSAAAYVSARLASATAAGDAWTGVADFIEFWRRSLVDSEFRAGCPIAALVTAGDDIPADVAGMAQATFETMERQLAGAFGASGIGDGDAVALAAGCIAAIEGAITMSRAKQTTAPLDLAETWMRSMFIANGGVVR